MSGSQEAVFIHFDHQPGDGLGEPFSFSEPQCLHGDNEDDDYLVSSW